MDDLRRGPLGGLVELWWTAANDLLTLLDELTEDEWSLPTDLPGWDVRAVGAHVAHLESLLAGGPQETADVPDLPHVRGPMGQFTEIGVLTRRDRSGDAIVAEIREMTSRRRRDLLDSPPTDPEAPAEGIFGAIGWSTRTLLRNRPLDLFLHEQDVRRATGRPGNLDSAAGDHTTSYLMESLGYVLAKRTAAPAGITAVLEVEGSAPVAAVVGEDGRGRLLDSPPATPTVRLRTDRESFLLRAAGRRDVPLDRFAVSGDGDLAARIVASLAVTP